MKRFGIYFLLFFSIYITSAARLQAQCSICTKTAQQLGEKPAKGMNSGIIYLMLAPMGIMGYLGYRWWKSEKQ